MPDFLLRKHDLEQFADFCASQGWLRMSVTRTAWNQVLRMDHSDRREPLIVCSARDAVYLSVYGESRKMLDAWGATGGAWVEPTKPVQGRML